MDEDSLSQGHTGSGYYGGKGVVRPVLGFGTAYDIGHPCWGKGDAFIVVHYALSLEDQPQTEGFGPDKNGNLISLGKLAKGWFVTSGNPGRIGG